MSASQIGTRGRVAAAIVTAVIVAVIAWIAWAVLAGDRGYGTTGETIGGNLEPLRHGAVLAFFRMAWIDSTILQKVLVIALGVVLPVVLAIKLQDNRIFRLDAARGVLRTRKGKVPLDRVRSFALADRGLTVHIYAEDVPKGSEAAGSHTRYSAHGISSAQWPAVRRLAAAAGEQLDPSRSRAVHDQNLRSARESAEEMGIVWRDAYDSPHAEFFFDRVSSALRERLEETETAR